MKEGACAHIDLSALRHNLSRVREIVGARQILAMVKADGYGHGLVRVARALEDADALGVAGVEEAFELCDAGIQNPIFIMSRFDNEDQLAPCMRYQLPLVIHQPYQVEILERSPLEEPVSVWLKLETGMHRLGLLPEQFIDAWQRLNRLSWIQQPIGLMTHLACADEPAHPLNDEQLRNFQRLVADFPGPKSVANSAAILSRPDSLYDLVRPGIMLYGASPFAGQTGEQLDLRPVMTLTSHLIAVHQARRGDFIGYGATAQCPEDMLIGVVAIGYGDGYPRHAANGTPVLINGVICPLFGRVSMDMITVDLRSLPSAQVGDPVVLWGKGLPAEHIAEKSSTITYELFCRLTRRTEFETHGQR